MIMREIKFRAWNTKRNEMITTFDGITQNSIGISKADNLSLLKVSYSGNEIFKPNWGTPVILMQYTGLKDKNGVEIYEGDILSDYTETDEGLIKSHCQVFWNEPTGSWHLDNSSKQDKTFSTELWIELDKFDYEISGNIYENPELLTQ